MVSLTSSISRPDKIFGRDRLIEWPAYTEQNDQYLHIGQKLQVKKGIKGSYVAPPSR